MSLPLPYAERWREVPFIRTVGEYDGQASIRVGATQLPAEFSRAASVRVVDDWVEFLSAGPTPIRELEFTSRTPKRLFAALGGQTQLELLHIKWGDFDDLGVLTGMTALTDLALGGASSVHSLEPLAGLATV